LVAAEQPSTFRPETRRRLGALPRPRVVRAVVGRDFAISRSYRLTFALDAAYGIVNLALFFFISRTFAHTPSTDLHGAPSYFAFAAVGFAVTVVIDSASTTLANSIRGEQVAGTLEALLMQPITVGELAFGLAAYPFIFALIRAVMYLTIAGVWIHLDLAGTSSVGLVAMLITSGAAFTGLGILLGALVVIVKRGQVIVTMVIFGMGFVSGAFFPVPVLPGWIQPIGRVVPTRFAFDGLRSAMFGGGNWGTDALALLAYGVVGIPLAVWVFTLALRLARRTGSLGQY
jgi:ABC-type multidrug transport system permease subunit